MNDEHWGEELPTFTRDEHERQCAQAGCNHPAYYDLGGASLAMWCRLCRNGRFRPGGCGAHRHAPRGGDEATPPDGRGARRSRPLR